MHIKNIFSIIDLCAQCCKIVWRVQSVSLVSAPKEDVNILHFRCSDDTLNFAWHFTFSRTSLMSAMLMHYFEACSVWSSLKY